jgi:hypothetical protein
VKNSFMSWQARSLAPRLSPPRTPATGIRAHECLRRPFGFPDRAEDPALETVEGAFGRKEAEAAPIAGDNPRGAILDFDDIGVGHDRSFAAKAALPSDLDAGL